MPFLGRQLDDAGRELDVRQAEAAELPAALVEAVLDDRQLEEGVAETGGDPCRAIDGDLRFDVLGEVPGPPSELDDVDVVGRRSEEILHLAEAEAFEDVRSIRVRAAYRCGGAATGTFASEPPEKEQLG